MNAQQKMTRYELCDEMIKQRTRAEAREAALVVCLRETLKAMEQASRVMHYETSPIGMLGPIQVVDTAIVHAAALIAAQPQQDAPDPSLALIRELRDALLRHDGPYGENASLISRVSQYLREHGANKPEAGEAQEPGVKA